MRKNTLALLALAYGLSLSTQAANSDHGKALHDASCISCHSEMSGGDGSALYLRPDHKVKSVEALTAQVKQCETSLGLPWFDDDISDVAAYLDSKFYKFAKK